jgi:hypothetical protein
LYLSKAYRSLNSDEKRQNFVQMVKNGSIVSWHHFNLQGEYDFSDDYLKDSIDFELGELLDLDVA